MLSCRHLRVKGPHQDLISGVSFAAPAHQLTHISAPTALSRTTLALLASGRMVADEGEIWIEVAETGDRSEPTPAEALHEAEDADAAGANAAPEAPRTDAAGAEAAAPSSSGEAPASEESPTEEAPAAELTTDLATLRRATALVDSPGITSPEHHMTVRQLVAETLGLQPRPRRRSRTARTADSSPAASSSREVPPRKVSQWLEHTGYADCAHHHVATLDPLTRLHLHLSLAFSDPQVRLAVLDSPERHGATTAQIRDLAQQFCDPDNDTTVLMITAGTSPHTHDEELIP